MTLKNRFVIVTASSLVVFALGIGAPSFAQTSQKQLDIAAAHAQRKATVGANMNLNQAEATKFWPVYDAYEAKMDRVEARHVKELKDFADKYENLSDADAGKKLEEVIAIQQARLDIQKEFVPKFRDAIVC